MKRAYMVLDSADEKARTVKGCPNIGVEHLGLCNGRLLDEDGNILGQHTSSTLDFLRSDLKYKLENPDDYEIIDLIGQPTPERFKLNV